MQSTGQTSTQALSFTPMQGSAIMYGIVSSPSWVREPEARSHERPERLTFTMGWLECQAATATRADPRPCRLASTRLSATPAPPARGAPDRVEPGHLAGHLSGRRPVKVQPGCPEGL